MASKEDQGNNEIGKRRQESSRRVCGEAPLSSRQDPFEKSKSATHLNRPNTRTNRTISQEELDFVQSLKERSITPEEHAVKKFGEVKLVRTLSQLVGSEKSFVEEDTYEDKDSPSDMDFPSTIGTYSRQDEELKLSSGSTDALILDKGEEKRLQALLSREGDVAKIINGNQVLAEATREIKRDIFGEQLEQPSEDTVELTVRVDTEPTSKGALSEVPEVSDFAYGAPQPSYFVATAVVEAFPPETALPTAPLEASQEAAEKYVYQMVIGAPDPSYFETTAVVEAFPPETAPPTAPPEASQEAAEKYVNQMVIGAPEPSYLETAPLSEDFLPETSAPRVPPEALETTPPIAPPEASQEAAEKYVYQMVIGAPDPSYFETTAVVEAFPPETALPTAPLEAAQEAAEKYVHQMVIGAPEPSYFETTTALVACLPETEPLDNPQEVTLVRPAAPEYNPTEPLGLSYTTDLVPIPITHEATEERAIEEAPFISEIIPVLPAHEAPDDTATIERSHITEVAPVPAAFEATESRAIVATSYTAEITPVHPPYEAPQERAVVEPSHTSEVTSVPTAYDATGERAIVDASYTTEITEIMQPWPRSSSIEPPNSALIASRGSLANAEETALVEQTPRHKEPSDELPAEELSSTEVKPSLQKYAEAPEQIGEAPRVPPECKPQKEIPSCETMYSDSATAIAEYESTREELRKPPLPEGVESTETPASEPTVTRAAPMQPRRRSSIIPSTPSLMSSRGLEIPTGTTDLVHERPLIYSPPEGLTEVARDNDAQKVSTSGEYGRDPAGPGVLSEYKTSEKPAVEPSHFDAPPVTFFQGSDEEAQKVLTSSVEYSPSKERLLAEPSHREVTPAPGDFDWSQQDPGMFQSPPSACKSPEGVGAAQSSNWDTTVLVAVCDRSPDTARKVVETSVEYPPPEEIYKEPSNIETTPLLVCEGTCEEAVQALDASLGYPAPKELPAAEQPSKETLRQPSAGFLSEHLAISVLRPDRDEPFRVLAGMPAITEPTKMKHPGARERTLFVTSPESPPRSFVEYTELPESPLAWEFELSKPQFDHRIERLHEKKVIKMSLVLRDGELVITSNTSNAQENGNEDNPGELLLEYVACEEQVLEGITPLDVGERDGAGPSSSYQGTTSHTTLPSAAVEDGAPNSGKEKGEENTLDNVRSDAE